jgi:hypothetical protein
VKFDVDTLPTVPEAPPEAGPDRALDPPPPNPGPLATPLLDAGLPDGAEGDMARPMDSPITAHISAAATIQPLIRFDSTRHIAGRRACAAMVTGADGPGEDAGGGGGCAPSEPELTASDGPELALGAG